MAGQAAFFVFKGGVRTDPARLAWLAHSGETGQSFRWKVVRDSGAKWPRVPEQTGHG